MEHSQETYIIISQWMLDCVSNSNTRLVLGLINGLSSKYGYCIASNQYLCDKLQISTKTLERNLKFLEDNHFIKRVVKVENNINCRKIYITPPEIKYSFDGDESPTKCRGGIRQNVGEGVRQNVGTYNKEYNREINIKENHQNIQDIFDYYELKVNKMLSAIEIHNLRELAEQYEFNILKQAVDKMVRDNKPSYRNVRKLGVYLSDIDKSQNSINQLDGLGDIWDE